MDITNAAVAVLAQYSLATQPVRPALHESVVMPSLIAERVGLKDEKHVEEVRVLWDQAFRAAVERTLTRAEIMAKLIKEDEQR
jgi:hypothetical protein